MIEKYLSCTNENTTVPIFQNILELNKAVARHIGASTVAYVQSDSYMHQITYGLDANT